MLNIKNIKEDTNAFVELMMQILTPAKEIQFKKVLSMQNLFTTEHRFENGSIEIFEDGIRLTLKGCRCSFVSFFDNDLQPARKKRGSKLVEKIDLVDIRKVDFSMM